MGKEKNNATGSLALAEPSGLANAVSLNQLATKVQDALADVDGYDALEIEDDGLTELGVEDIKLSMKVWNTKALDQNGDPILKTLFFDTLTEQTQRELNVILVKDHRTNEWATYDEATARTTVHCRSNDCVTGTMDDGTKRKCEGCPDARWETVVKDDGKTKRTRRCGPVANVYAVEIENLQPCLIRFKRKSLTVLQAYWSRYHLGKRMVKNPDTGRMKAVNYPAFAFLCRITLKMSDDKTHSVPVMETNGKALPGELIAQGRDSVPYVNAILDRQLSKVIEAEGALASGDDSFDTSKMINATGDSLSGGAGQDFTDPQPPPAQ